MNDETDVLGEIAVRHGITLDGMVSVGGGCINDSFRSGDYFLKFNRPGFLPQFEAEALALKSIEATKSIRVPGVVGHGVAGHQAYLVLEYLPLQSLSNESSEELGHRLAALHRHTSPEPGFAIDNAIGATPQPNTPLESWCEFWRERRLRHMFRLAEARGRTFAGAGALLERLDEFLPTSPPNSLLHGDLWAGNAASLPDGTPVIFDPASYHGHDEADLAMTRLFGGFPPSFYQAYHEERPQSPGYEKRIDLYQLYHVLNHFVLFGGGYAGQAERMIQGLLAA